MQKTISIALLSFAVIILILSNIGTLFSSPGILTWPGIITGVVAMFLRPKPTAIIAGMAGIISMVLQVRMGFCLPCLASAMLFLLVCVNNVGYSWFPCVAPIILLLMVLTLTQAEKLFFQILLLNQSEKPMVYFTVGCSPCKQVINNCIKYDRQGKKWQPVCPASIYQEGEKYLRSKGYSGRIETGQTRIVPALEIGDKIYYTGINKRVEEIFKR